MNRIVIGTRGSRLALYQANEVKRLLEEAHQDLEVVLKIIKTQGDKRLDLSLNASGDKGLFTKELEHALLSGEIDCAVHSLKDLPVDLTEGTCLGAVLPREEVADVLLGNYTFDQLPMGAVVGTSSPRRAAQLLEQRPDLEIREIRGNVETRIEKLHRGEYDAIVMAKAGLKRLGLESEVRYEFTTFEMVPAPGQAAIAVQQRAGDDRLERLLSSIHCSRTARCTEIERYILKQVGGGCAVPFACLCSEAYYQSVTEGKKGEIERGAYFLTVYNLYDETQTLKSIAVSSEASNEEIWQYLQEETVPVSREKFS